MTWLQTWSGMERVFWRGICSIFSEFERLSPFIVDAGLIESSEVEYVLNGLRNGVDLGVDESKLQAKRIFRSYKNVQNILVSQISLDFAKLMIELFEK